MEGGRRAGSTCADGWRMAGECASHALGMRDQKLMHPAAHPQKQNDQNGHFGGLMV